ncbi:MAG TPA: S49 family peptidase [Stellaceae bacterium]|nr:S49 family peptidase [Stellaceae bacterium]
MSLKNLLDRVPLGRLRSRHPVVGVLRLNGVIAAPSGRRASGLSLAGLAAQIERVFKLPNLQAVALLINSPGGSPVQSSLIHRRIRQLAAERSVPVLAFAEDVAASGGYWLALAADEIYAENTSIVGSIGVISASFGFTDLMRRIGVERRVYTAGQNKGLLDPFLIEDPTEITRLKVLQLDIHDSFKELVRERRGSRLTGAEDGLFNGSIFTGRQALANGLIDGIGDVRSVIQERFGTDTKLRLIGERRSRWRLPLPFRSSAASSGLLIDMADELIATIEQRALWGRFGL